MRRFQQRVPAWLISAGVCLALVASAMVPASPALAQSFLFDVGVNFPEYVVLWYWDQIDIEITTAALTNYLFGQSTINAGSQSITSRFAGSTLTVDAGIDGVVDDGVINDPDARIWLGVPNAWAMRSVSSSGDTQVSVSVTRRSGRLAGPGRNRIRVRDAQVAAASSLGRSIVVPSTGSGGVLWGTIYLQVDISNAKRAGDYTGIVVEITAENI